MHYRGILAVRFRSPCRIRGLDMVGVVASEEAFDGILLDEPGNGGNRPCTREKPSTQNIGTQMYADIDAGQSDEGREGDEYDEHDDAEGRRELLLPEVADEKHSYQGKDENGAGGMG